MDFGDTKFNAIVSFYAVFHIPKEEHATLFSKIYDMLQNGGLLLLTLGTRYGDTLNEDRCGASMARSSHSKEAYHEMFHHLGFDIVMEEFEGQPGDVEYHWWILLKKNVESASKRSN